jgi:nitric-oxide synthase
MTTYHQLELQCPAEIQDLSERPIAESGTGGAWKRLGAAIWGRRVLGELTALGIASVVFTALALVAIRLGWVTVVLLWVGPRGAPAVGVVGVAGALFSFGVLVLAHQVGGRVAKHAARTGPDELNADPFPAARVQPAHEGLPTPPGQAKSASAVNPDEAAEFLELFHAENPSAGPARPRIAAVYREIEQTGTYWHTPEELAFGARVAWRNNSRCIGRLYWKSLRVRDHRKVGDVAGVASRCVDHLRAASRGGKIRPTISIFAPDTPAAMGPRIWNEQLIRYAGYELPGGRVLGDPRYRAFTEEVQGHGWRPPEQRGAFDVLPLVVESADEGPRLFVLPGDAVHEVQFEHPELPWFSELGLRWHALPVISNNRLIIGGVSYAAAPFNGWYMGTEIGVRNFGDTERYDLIPVIAERMGLDTTSETTLWRDKALVEINRAVLHSFTSQGVSITDHHTESHRFLTHLEREESAGRSCPADWSWIVPPMSGAQTPVFHRYYDTEERVPNFVLDPDAAQRGLQGGPPRFA